MSIPRFRHHGSHGVPECISEHVNGEWVRYKNHLAAVADALASTDGQSVILASECEKRVAEAEQRAVEGFYGQSNYQVGYADALGKAREALELLALSLVDTRFDPDDERCYVQAVRLTSALAAIDALVKEKP